MNGLDNYLNTLGQQRNDQLAGSLRDALQVNPDDYAKTVRLAKAAGVKVEAVPLYADVAQEAQYLEGIGFRTLWKDSPKTAEFLSDSGNARLAHDDVANLSVLEKLARSAGAGLTSANAGLWGMAQAGTDIFVKPWTGLMSGLGVLPEDVGTRMSDSFSRLRRIQDDKTDALMRNDDGLTLNGVYSGVQSVTQTLAMAPAAIMTGNPALMLAPLAGIAGGRSYGKARDAGRTPAVAAMYGFSDGTVEYLTEKIPAGRLFGDLQKGVNWKKMLAGQLGHEAWTEQVATAFQDLNEWAVLNPDRPFTEYLADRPAAAYQTLVASIVAAGAQTAVIKGADRALNGDRVRRQKESQAFFEGLADTSRQSRLRERMPESFRDLMDKLTADGPVSTVFMDARRFRQYFQDAGLDPAVVAKEVGAKDYSEALALGGDLSIPTSHFAEKLAGSEHFSGLAPDLRLSPADLTGRELQEQQARLDDLAREWADRMASEGPDTVRDEQGMSVADTIQADLVQQLEAAGFEPDTARQQAAVTTAFFMTMGERTGQGPAELFQRYFGGVTRPVPDALRQRIGTDDLDPLLDRLRSGDIPSQADVFGQSLTGFLREFGISDPAGELAGRDLDKGLKAFQRRMVRDDGISLDQAVERAVEAGFFPGQEIGEVSVADLLDTLLEDETRPVYSARQADPAMQATRDTLMQVGNYLDQLGVDLSALDNAAVKAALQGELPTEQTVQNQAERVFNQSYDKLKDAAGRLRRAAENITNGVPISNQPIDFGETPYILQKLGAKALPLEMRDPKKLLQIVKSEGQREDGHGLSADVLSQIPYALHDPLAVFASATHENALVVVTELKDGKGNPVVTAIHLSKKAKWHEINQVASIYGKDNAATAFPKWVQSGGLLYVNDKSPNALSSAGVQFPMDELHQGFGENVLLRSELVNDDTVLSQAGSQPRGRIRFGADRVFRIELLDGADLSTFQHETAHMFLEILGDMAQAEQAPQQIRADYAAVLQWFGVASRDQIQVEQHEQWARGFEQYLKEGKAPSAELQGVFARFKAWLRLLYGRLRGDLNVTLSDEVRGVYDRLLATDEQIRQVRETTGLGEPMWSDAAEAGMTEAEWDVYRQMRDDAREEADSALTARMMAEQHREHLAWWKEARQKVRSEVAEEASSSPLVQAMAFLRDGRLPNGTTIHELVKPAKLSRQVLVERYGEAFLKRLPRPYLYTREGGVSPDEVAELFGFASGDELVYRLADAPSPSKTIEAETDVRMRQRYGDMMTDGTLAERATEALHGNRQLDLMLAELRALSRRAEGALPAGFVVTPRELFRQMAERTIGQKTARQVRPHVWLQAERRAANEAIRAAAKGDLAAAVDAKQRQIMNHELYGAAVAATERVERIQRHMAKLGQTKVRQRIGKAGGDYLDQLDALLELYEFRPVSAREVQRRENLAAWLEKQAEAGFDAAVPAEVAARTRVVNYRDVPLDELEAVHDTAKMIEHLAGTKNKLLKARDKRDYEATVEAIVGSIQANNAMKDGYLPLNPTRLERIRQQLESVDAWHIKPEALFRQLDGDQLGEAHRSLFLPLEDAQNAESVMWEETARNLQAIWGRYSRKELAELYGRKHQIPALQGDSMTKAQIMSLALNWGNAGNRQAVLKGNDRLKDKPESIEAIISLLSAKDLETVQMIWDEVGRFWPQIEAMQKRLTGLAPEKVEATPFVVNGVELRGGYYPLKYDAQRSYRAFKRGEDAGARLFENHVGRAATRRGHTIERVGSSGQPVRLDLSVLGDHLQQVIHDLAFREAIIDVNRLLANEHVRGAIEGATNREIYRALLPWLKRIANEKTVEQPSPTEKIIGRVRAGTTLMAMGWKVTTAIVQPLGYLSSVQFLGSKWSARGLRDFLGSPEKMQATRDFVYARSPMMRNRQTGFDRDVHDQLSRLAGKHDALNPVRKTAFYFTGLMDMAVAIPTWMGAYRKAILEDGATEREAIEAADHAVRFTQSSGYAKDLARIQGGSELRRMFTMFYSYFSALYQMEKRSFRNVKSIQDMPKFVADQMLLWFVPAILGELVAGRGPGEDEDWSDWFADNWWKIATYPAQTVVGLRDIIGAINSPFGYEISPVARALEAVPELVNRAADMATGERDLKRSDVKLAVDLAGTWMALPSSQAWITGSYLYDLATDQEDPADPFEFLRNLVFTRRKAA
ncbi:MuF-C-terminal domain-containing protein [Laribacter hongkongensis]|uniref:MuF-C-terminal domain-containing protein n=1 Tax=Laribacter hongkongensis TaxID=168471 RepID=UPI001EFDE09F|nr:hypothetical protein [Laribacter hongkongensis]MCG9045080.1 hypothetical protein [Laribacter hongkongensis]